MVTPENSSLTPPLRTNAEGKPRRVGIEFEYGGLSLFDSATLIAELFGGTVEEKTLNHFEVDTPEFGRFDIKLDMHAMQKLSVEAAAHRKAAPESETLEMLGEKILSPLLSTWVPNEIVTPPLPYDRLDAAEQLNAGLRACGAKGTRASPIYAFGLHLNPEMPAMDPARLRDYLAAFVARQDWLKQETKLDLTRQLTSFAPPFSYPYATLLLAEDYRPDIGTLIDDYLLHNPTRNRALDMLPLFMHLDEPRVRKVIKDDRVHARPAFHYRLPNCDLDNPGWSPLEEWRTWLEVEKLAEDPERLRCESATYLAAHRPLLDQFFS